MMRQRARFLGFLTVLGAGAIAGAGSAVSGYAVSGYAVASPLDKCPANWAMPGGVAVLPDFIAVAEFPARTPDEPRYDFEATYFRRWFLPGVRTTVLDVSLATRVSETAYRAAREAHPNVELRSPTARSTYFRRFSTFPDVAISFGQMHARPVPIARAETRAELFHTAGFADRMRFTVSRRGMDSIRCAMSGVDHRRKWRRILRREGRSEREIERIVGPKLMLVMSELHLIYDLKADLNTDVPTALKRDRPSASQCEHVVPLAFDLEDESSPMWEVFASALSPLDTRCDDPLTPLLSVLDELGRP